MVTFHNCEKVVFTDGLISYYLCKKELKKTGWQKMETTIIMDNEGSWFACYKHFNTYITNLVVTISTATNHTLKRGKLATGAGLAYCSLAISWM